MAASLSKTLGICGGALLLVTLMLVEVKHALAATDIPVNAVAVLVPNNDTVSGIIFFTQLNTQQAVKVNGTITGLKPGTINFLH
jgi:hypothetical protein